MEGLERKLLLSLILQSGTDESLGLLVTQYDSRSVSDDEIVGLLSKIQAYQTATAFSVEKLYVSIELCTSCKDKLQAVFKAQHRLPWPRG